MTYLQHRRDYSEGKFSSLLELVSHVEPLLEGNACVYATGSYGRFDAGEQSDLDLFIVSKVGDRNGKSVNLLSNLDVILIKAELIKAVRELGLPDFDGDGKYLECHSIRDFVDHLGGPEDDYRNTMTGRLLMFLEGRPLVCASVFNELIAEIIAVYFVDFSDHSDAFIPAFLCNDILRLWRTFCVNYEFARRKDTATEKSRIKNFKLKHSRMLTCYSAICYMLHAHAVRGTVTVEDVIQMVRLSPLDRIDAIVGEAGRVDMASIRDGLFKNYSLFLQKLDKPEVEVKEDFAKNGPEWIKDSYEFGDLMHRLLGLIHAESRFGRLLLV